MKINHLHRLLVPTGDMYDEDKPLYLGHNLTFLPGTPPKTTSPGGRSRIHKERKLNKNKNSVQLANTCNKIF